MSCVFISCKFIIVVAIDIFDRLLISYADHISETQINLYMCIVPVMFSADLISV